MKKSSLTTAVVAGLAGVAGLVNVSNALNVNPDGLGQVLIYPYYTVNAGNTTLVSIVNTTDDVKAVKVRFLEGRNSQEVLDFNLYLSPFDVWTGGIIDRGNGAGPAYLVTNDNSCTVPRIKGNPSFPNGVPFVNFEYASNNDDGGPYELERTREGHIEMIEMGRVVNNGDNSTVAPSPTVGSTSAIDRQTNPAAFATAALATAAIHAQSGANAGIPNNCGRIEAAWATGGQWATNANLDIDTPNGGLFGSGSIVDVANGSNLAYNADAIEGFFVSESFANLHANPGTVDPTLGDARSSDSGEATAVIFDNGQLLQFTYTGALAGRDAVSAVFMHNEIYNEYNTSASVDADSEWVITFPTKRLHVEEIDTFDKLPFTSDYLGDDEPYDDLIGACEPINVSFYNREERVPGNIPSELIFSPPPPNVETPGLNLCFESQVVTFNQPTAGEVLVGNDPSAILGSFFPRNLNLCQVYNQDGTCQGGTFTEGWLRMELGNGVNNFLPVAAGGEDPTTGANILVGLPATGFWAANYINSAAQPGLLATYAGLHKHRGDREPVIGTVIGPNDDDLYEFIEGGSAPTN
jgi:hypothetical protein